MSFLEEKFTEKICIHKQLKFISFIFTIGTFSINISNDDKSKHKHHLDIHIKYFLENIDERVLSD
jgi:hypothetical protein